MKRKISIPYVKWRDGQPRFAPGSNIRAMGFSGTDLRHPVSGKISPASLVPGTKNKGAWFGAGEAMDWSEAFQKQLAARENATAVPQVPRAPKRARARPTRATAPTGSYPLSQLFEDWKRSPSFREDLTKSTQGFYQIRINKIAEELPDFYAAEIDAFDRPIIFGIHEEVRQTSGLTAATAVIRTISTAFNWGLNTGKFNIRDTNPCLQLKLKQAPPRVRVASRDELLHLIKAADLVGRADVGDAAILGVWSGQRQGDRLLLQLVKQLKQRIQLKQSKTGALIDIPMAPELEKRWKAAQKRRQAANIASKHFLLFEKTWRPWNQHTYKHYFVEVRRVAVAGLWRAPDGRLVCPVNDPLRYLGDTVSAGTPEGECILNPMPSLYDFWEMDLRDTAVTWMAMAGAQIPEICAVTGHSLDSATKVLRHYLALHPDMADSAIAKMVAWYEKR